MSIVNTNPAPRPVGVPMPPPPDTIPPKNNATIDTNRNPVTSISPRETQPEYYDIYTKPSLGRIRGYSEITKETTTPDGTKTIITETTPGLENIKSSSPEKFLNKQSERFRRIGGYPSSVESDNLEDPTYLIFDLSIMSEESPLFNPNGIRNFMESYSELDNEIRNRMEYLNHFYESFFKIFPGQINDLSSGYKNHYINSISGLDLLEKPIINYPEDKIIINVSEDVTMLLMYISELYNNITYSYNTHRYLIPDNLLRFNMRLMIKDVRNFRKPKDNVTLGVQNNNSVFIYILHDCQFNFMGTKSFTDQISRAGYSADIGMSNGGNISLNFKSYSKILAPLLIDNSRIIDFREKENQDANFYKTVFTDIKDESIIIQREIDQERELRNTSMAGLRPTSSDETNSWLRTDTYWKPNELKRATEAIGTVERSFRDGDKIIKQQIATVRDSLVNNLYQQTNQLIDRAQRWLGENVGFTIGKVNVYYDSITDLPRRYGDMFTALVGERLSEAFGNDTPRQEIPIRDMEINVYTGSVRRSIGRGESLPDRNKTPDSDSSWTTGVHPDGQYNEKYPEGDVHPDGQYNEKYPEGDVHPDGQYNEKYPEGDVHPDGQYNQKLPDGKVHESGQYNEKFPEGDLHEDNIYNEKFPSGNVYKRKPPLFNNDKDLGNVYKKKK